MNNSIFRKSSIDRISSPEQLDDYIRIATPSAFMTVAAVVILLIGICVWGVFGSLDTTLTVCAVNGAEGLSLYVPETEIGGISVGDSVNIGDETFEITEISARPAPAGELVSAYAMHAGGLSAGQWVYEARLNGSKGAEGDVYPTRIVLESVSPVSFVFN